MSCEGREEDWGCEDGAGEKMKSTRRRRRTKTKKQIAA
jgi:hypothetical protein